MRLLLVFLVLPAGLCFASACGDEAATDPDPSGVDAALPEAAAPDTSIPLKDSGPDDDAQQGVDAADAGPPLNELYSLIDGKLVTVDPTTGAVVEIGPTTPPLGFAAIVWDTKAKVARVIIDGVTSPKIGTIDLCTGAVSTGPRMKVGNDDVDKAEGLAQDPASGKFYVTVDVENSVSTLTRANATLDVGTGAVTVHGNHTTLQNDGDVLAWIGSSLYLMDIDSPNQKSAYYTVNLSTGATTLVKEVVDASMLLRFAHDPTRDTVFALRGSNNFQTRGLATLDLATGALTNIGAGLAPTTYPGVHFQTLASAPKPSCL
jgi:hypothetical protein